MTNKNKSSVVFFGTGPVAAASLEGIKDDFIVELVITKSRPAHHRNLAPVETLSNQLGLKISFANSKQEVDSILEDSKLQSEIGLVIDFGVMLSGFAITKFKKGIINSHFSLLPRWRGADPITYSILAGDQETGVSLMKIVEQLDGGPLIAQEVLLLDNNINATQLTEKLVKLSNDMLKKYLPKYLNGEIAPNPQPNIIPTYSSKIKKEDGVIDWTKPVTQIQREIRAYVGWPKSRTKLGSTECIITEAEISMKPADKPGSYQVQDGCLLVSANDSYLLIKRLQPAGKREMSVEEFLRGYRSKL